MSTTNTKSVGRGRIFIDNSNIFGGFYPNTADGLKTAVIEFSGITSTTGEVTIGTVPEASEVFDISGNVQFTNISDTQYIIPLSDTITEYNLVPTARK